MHALRRHVLRPRTSAANGYLSKDARSSIAFWDL